MQKKVKVFINAFLNIFLISSFGKEISFTVMSDPGAQRFSQSAAQILIIAHSARVFKRNTGQGCS